VRNRGFEKPGFFRQPLPPTPETGFLQITFATNPRNRVSCVNLCHQPKTVIETRFLLCRSQLNRKSIPRNRVSSDNLCHQPTTLIETRFLAPVSCPGFFFCRSQVAQKSNPRNLVYFMDIKVICF
jgi:hypothetical protein